MRHTTCFPKNELNLQLAMRVLSSRLQHGTKQKSRRWRCDSPDVVVQPAPLQRQSHPPPHSPSHSTSSMNHLDKLFPFLHATPKETKETDALVPEHPIHSSIQQRQGTRDEMDSTAGPTPTHTPPTAAQTPRPKGKLTADQPHAGKTVES